MANHGLIQDLLSRLQRVGEGVHNASTTSTPGKSSVSGDGKTSASVSTVISLLSTLCRGSPSITHDLLRSSLPEAIESGLQGDERYVYLMLELVSVSFIHIINILRLCGLVS